MDSKTISEAFGVEAEESDELELDESEVDEADESTLDSDIDLAFDASAPAADRREAFRRAVKAAMRG